MGLHTTFFFQQTHGVDNGPHLFALRHLHLHPHSHAVHLCYALSLGQKQWMVDRWCEQSGAGLQGQASQSNVVEGDGDG